MSDILISFNNWKKKLKKICIWPERDFKNSKFYVSSPLRQSSQLSHDMNENAYYAKETNESFITNFL